MAAPRFLGSQPTSSVNRGDDSLASFELPVLGRGTHPAIKAGVGVSGAWGYLTTKYAALSLASGRTCWQSFRRSGSEWRCPSRPVVPKRCKIPGATDTANALGFFPA